jgi:hypothetical protein
MPSGWTNALAGGNGVLVDEIVHRSGRAGEPGALGTAWPPTMIADFSASAGGQAVAHVRPPNSDFRLWIDHLRRVVRIA